MAPGSISPLLITFDPLCQQRLVLGDGPIPSDVAYAIASIDDLQNGRSGDHDAVFMGSQRASHGKGTTKGTMGDGGRNPTQVKWITPCMGVGKATRHCLSEECSERCEIATM